MKVDQKQDPNSEEFRRFVHQELEK